MVTRQERGSGLVVFDIDGTLTDTVALHQAAFLRALQSFDFPSLNSDWSSYRHHTDSGIFADAWQAAGRQGPGPADQLDFSARLDHEFRQLQPMQAIREIPGAAAFVALLRDKGWSVGFATGGLRALARLKLEHAGISFDEDTLVTASEHLTREEIVGATIVAMANDHAGSPGTPVSVGDGLWDLATAQNLGLGFLGVGTGSKAQLLTERGATVVADFADQSRALELIVAMAGRAGLPASGAIDAPVVP